MEQSGEKPKVITGVIILNGKGEIFLAKCPKWSNMWVIPGGKLDMGETLTQCVAREAKEETNLDIGDIELVGIQESIYSEHYHKKCHMIFMDFSAKAKSSDVVLNREFTEYKWALPEEALNLELNISTRKFIEKFIAKTEGKNPPIL